MGSRRVSFVGRFSEGLGFHCMSLTFPFLQALIERTLSFPHNPYVPAAKLDQDYYLLLLRSGVIQHHPDKPTLIKMTPFHH